MVWVDLRSTLTPGQKFSYWERQGIHLRIEVGMKDVNAGQCKVVKSQRPEDYASVVKRDVALRGRKLLQALKDLAPTELDWLQGPQPPSPGADDDDDNLM